MIREPQGGELYRHFKGGMYRVITVATHSETGERLVIYQAQYGDWLVYARPLDMFVSEVDHRKYPDAVQQYRFERAVGNGVVEPVMSGSRGNDTDRSRGNDTDRKDADDGDAQVADTEERGQKKTNVNDMPGGTAAGEESSDGISPKLMAFLDADDLEERYQILVSMRDEVNDHLINNMAVVMDVVIPEGEIGDRYEQLKNCIRTKQRYEAVRLR